MKRFLLIICYLLIICSVKAQTVTDIDGNVYKTVKIGNQEWMVRNLKVTKLNDGKKIPHIKKWQKWLKTKSPAYCMYEYNKDYIGFGCYYNYYAIETNKLCPDGWHIPSAADWRKLIDSFGGTETAGIALKYNDEDIWTKPTIGPATNRGFMTSNADKSFKAPTNSSLFYGFAGGQVDSKGESRGLTYHGYWWSADSFYSDQATYFYMSYNKNVADFFHGEKGKGLNVRCVKD
jgi:uncharacterized protein (TIGR02145 family)